MAILRGKNKLCLWTFASKDGAIAMVKKNPMHALYTLFSSNHKILAWSMFRTFFIDTIKFRWNSFYGYFNISWFCDESLSVCFSPQQSDLWYFIDDGPLFDSLPAVIDHYMLFQDGLPTILRHPVNTSGKKINPSKVVSEESKSYVQNMIV